MEELETPARAVGASGTSKTHWRVRARTQVPELLLGVGTCVLPPRAAGLCLGEP